MSEQLDIEVAALQARVREIEGLLEDANRLYREERAEKERLGARCARLEVELHEATLDAAVKAKARRHPRAGGEGGRAHEARPTDVRRQWCAERVQRLRAPILRPPVVTP